MKKFPLFLLTLLTIVTTISFNAVSQKGAKAQFTINAKGWLYNASGAKIGYIDKNDVVRDNTGKGMFSVDMSGNVATADGRQLGMVKKNGSYCNVKGESILNIKDLGNDQYQIIDASGHALGKAHKNYKQHAYAALLLANR
ncbi:MAG: hypothetical protein V4553_07075 [Bacteroidota bacterium]